MADIQAIAFVESIYRRTDQQIRDILAVQEPTAEVDTINVIIGDGLTALIEGIGAAIRVDFRSRITGIFLQEFDGVTGSVGVMIEKAAAGASPAWATITPTSPPAISSGRFFADEDLGTWADTAIERGDMLRFSIVSASTIARVHIGLRIRRLEP